MYIVLYNVHMCSDGSVQNGIRIYYNLNQNMNGLKNIIKGPCNSLGHTVGYKYGIRSSKFIWAPMYSCAH
jgi:hypothetical protein